jgi:Helix-turn-helix domain
MLAGISTDYYIRLEQGRHKHPSQQVIEALAEALLLEDEGGRVPARPGRSGHVPAHPPGGPPGVRVPGAGRADGRLAQHPGAVFAALPVNLQTAVLPHVRRGDRHPFFPDIDFRSESPQVANCRYVYPLADAR